jgi:hypothetical protein
MCEKQLEQTSADALTLVRGCDGDLVDPQLRRLVGVHVVDGGCHADDLARV